MSGQTSLRFADLSRLVHRELVLLVVLVVVASGLFVITRAIAGATHEREAVDAAAWFERGQAALDRRAYAEAVEALRRASARAPDTWDYARALTDALVADGRVEAARQLLLRWRARQPESAQVNIRLARLEADAGDLDAAIGYYEAAFHGRWDAAAPDGRLDVRRELIERLLAAGRRPAALGQVLSLAANVADAPAAQLDVAALFLRAGDPARALDRYQRALRLAPADPAARAGAADAAFQLGDDARALGYARGLADPRSRYIVAVASAVAALDPLATRISARERERRLREDLRLAADALANCRARTTPATPLQARTNAALAEALQSRQAAGATASAGDDGATGPVLDLIRRAIDVVARECAPLDPRTEALWRLAQRHGAGA